MNKQQCTVFYHEVICSYRVGSLFAQSHAIKSHRSAINPFFMKIIMFGFTDTVPNSGVVVLQNISI